MLLNSIKFIRVFISSKNFQCRKCHVDQCQCRQSCLREMLVQAGWLWTLSRAPVSVRRDLAKLHEPTVSKFKCIQAKSLSFCLEWNNADPLGCCPLLFLRRPTKSLPSGMSPDSWTWTWHTASPHISLTKARHMKFLISKRRGIFFRRTTWITCELMVTTPKIKPWWYHP